MRIPASIAGARITISIDIGFGDATAPGLEWLDRQQLLDAPPARIRAYSRETVVAEKTQAIVALGLANTRLKDFYDLWVLANDEPLDEARTTLALTATFARRRTDLPTTTPIGLTEAYSMDPAHIQQWRAFGRDLQNPTAELPMVVERVAKFIMPHIERARAALDASNDPTR